MKLAERYSFFVSHFKENMPAPETELAYSNPFELVVAVSLSAQCTDKRVNMVTTAIFRDFPDAHSMANTAFDTLFQYIKSVSFPNNKTKNLISMAQRLESVYNSIVPDSVKELETLAGVGRKTANVVVSVIYQQPAMAVDTHVFRVSKRLGLVKSTANTPLEVEKQLVKNLPKSVIHLAHHWLILHGRYTCVARKPKCDICTITNICALYQKNLKMEAKNAV